MSYWDTRTEQPRTPKLTETKLSDGFKLRRPPEGWTQSQLEACGMVRVVTTPRPDDTATERHRLTVELVNGIPTQVWVAEAKTAEEQAAEADAADREADRAELVNDLDKAKLERDDAAQERAEMDDTDPAYLPEWDDADVTPWVPVARGGQTNQRIAALADAVDLLGGRTEDHARLLNLHTRKIRKLWGSVRLLSALIVRKLRADRNDEAA